MKYFEVNDVKIPIIGCISFIFNVIRCAFTYLFRFMYLFLVGTYKIKGFDSCFKTVDSALQLGYRLFGKDFTYSYFYLDLLFSFLII